MCLYLRWYNNVEETKHAYSFKFVKYTFPIEETKSQNKIGALQTIVVTVRIIHVAMIVVDHILSHKYL